MSVEGDAKYLKRKVKAGSLDVHPTEKALVVNYELEATILGELGDPMLGERKECQKIIRLKSLDAQTDISALAKEVINKCKLIHPSKLAEVEQLLYYLQNRKERAMPTTSGADAVDGQNRVNSAGLHRYSPAADDVVDDELANINNLEEYIELLYEEGAAKVRGARLILQLARNPDNLEELSQNETLLGALSRVLREEWKTSVDLTTNIIYIFFCFSTFSQFHPVIGHYKVGSLVMDIVNYEIGRYQQWSEDLAKKNRKKEKNSEQQEAAENKLTAFIAKQEKTLRVSFYLLLNLAEDPKVEEKMKKKRMIYLLASTLNRKNVELLILVVSFLKKMSCYFENKEEMKTLHVVDKLVPLLSFDNHDLIHAVVRLLLNLSFDADLRSKMIQAGALPKLVSLLHDERHQNPVCCVLYHLSMDDKVKSMFTYTDCIPIVMRLILETTEEQVDLEIMSLAINLAANKRNAQLICEGHGLRVLMQRAFHYQDALIMKMVRNISQHDGMTKTLFIEFIGDVADAVQRADSEEFRVECLGVLGNLTIPDLDFERMLTEYDLVPWMKKRLTQAGGGGGRGGGGELDDLILEIVVFVGTCATDSAAASYICKSDLLSCLIELLKAKQEDDEMVLQVVYVFYLLCTHDSTRSFIIEETDAVAYLIDLLHDKNPQVQKVCDATLDIISQIDDHWAEKVQREKFQFHNAQWLDIVQSQQQQHHMDHHNHHQRHRGDGGSGGSGRSGVFGGSNFMDGLAPSSSGHAGGYFDQDVDDFEQLVRDSDVLDNGNGVMPNGVVGAEGTELILQGVAEMDLLSSSSAEIEAKWP